MVWARRTSWRVMLRSRAEAALAAFRPAAGVSVQLGQLFPSPASLRQLHELGHLLRPLHRCQFRSVQVLADRPHPGFDVVHVDEPDQHAFDAEQPERLDPVPASDQDITRPSRSMTVGADCRPIASIDRLRSTTAVAL